MQCPRCQAENKAGRKFCSACGQPLSAACPQCAFVNEPGDQFCGGCGRDLTASTEATPTFPSPHAYTPRHLTEKILTSRSALEGERKQVTIVFCDLANSTALAERLGPEAMHVLLNRFFELSLAEVNRYEGTINQFLGDGFMALFGAPLAHEDHARRAILAALGIQRTLREPGAELGLPRDEELSVRMGVNTGVVVVGKIGDNLRMDYTAVGDTTNVAARLQQLAEPGTILISEATSRLAEGYVLLEPLAPIQVKGKSEPVAAYKLLGSGPRRSPMQTHGGRALSRFVGRERELATLSELLEQAEGGQGQVVGLLGEPGAGKSRLLFEFRRHLGGRRVTYLEGRCVSYGRAIPYVPVLDLLRSNCRIADADSPEAIARKVALALQEVGMGPDEWAPYLLQLLGVKEGTERLDTLEPEAIKARTFECLSQMTLRGCRQRPLIVAVEDLHWIDKSSEDYAASIVEHLADAPMLLLTTYRTDYRPPWMKKPYATEIALQPLSPQDSLSVVHSVLQQEQLPDPLSRVILEKAEGNPFFLEEVARTVEEHGELGPTTVVPDTIQGVLMARIDRLPEESKRLLQTASVLGRKVSLRLLAGIWDGPGDLGRQLRELTRLEFLYEEPGATEAAYVFKHALTQDVAYQSLLTPHRQALHAAAGRTLEGLYADRLEEAYDRLAHHYSKAEQAPKAVEYLTRFARKVVRGHSHAEAVTALQEALVHAERLPAEGRDRLLLDLVLRQVQSLNFLGRNEESLELLLQQRERMERLQDPSRAAPYYFSLGISYGLLADHEQAVWSLQRSIEEAKRCGDDRTMGRAYALLILESLWVGQPVQGIEYARHAAALLERTQQRYWLALAYFYLASIYYMMGELQPTLEAASRAHSIGEAIGNSGVQSYAACVTGVIQAVMGDWDVGIDACRRGLELAPDPLTSALARGWLGYTYLEKGDTAQAIPLLEQAAEKTGRFRYRQNQGWFTALLGEAHLLNGEIAKARDLAVQGLQLSLDAKFLLGVGLAQRALGRIARAEGGLEEADTHLHQALETFGSIHARFEVARTCLELGELARARNQPERAAAHIREAHRLFTALGASRYVEQTRQPVGE